jgi:hypothetical protein
MVFSLWFFHSGSHYHWQASCINNEAQNAAATTNNKPQTTNPAETRAQQGFTKYREL